MSSPRDVIGAFNKWAADYDAWYAENPELAALELEALEAIGLGGRGLEIGGGSGFFSAPLHSVVLEPAWGLASLARDRGLDVVAGVGELPPVRDSSLDYVLIVVTLCFLPDPLIVMGRAKDLLRPGGSLVACIVPKDSPYGRLYSEKGRRGHRFYSMAKFYAVGEVVDMMRAAGLSPLPATYASLGPSKGPTAVVGQRDAEEFGFACVRAVKSQ